MFLGELLCNLIFFFIIFTYHIFLKKILNIFNDEIKKKYCYFFLKKLIKLIKIFHRISITYSS